MLEKGETIDCAATPHIEAQDLAFGYHLTDDGRAGKVTTMMTLPDDGPLVIYAMSIGEAVGQHQELGKAIQAFLAFKAPKGGA